ncbi:hypothetical protein ABZY03_23850 [Streptomyces klenkii]|uniref:hypothetical protein n=1 Tax=Streptomyces klenkii TaxID=1420899 RepID=UPI0033A63B7F
MDKDQRARIVARVTEERERLRPLQPEMTRTVIELLRRTVAEKEPGVVPWVNLATIKAVQAKHGTDGILALSLSLGNWAAAVAQDFARTTGHTAEQLMDFYETQFFEDDDTSGDGAS